MSMALLGPGVIKATKVKTAKAKSVSAGENEDVLAQAVWRHEKPLAGKPGGARECRQVCRRLAAPAAPDADRYELGFLAVSLCLDDAGGGDGHGGCSEGDDHGLNLVLKGHLCKPTYAYLRSLRP